jgi:hypothetical protein
VSGIFQYGIRCADFDFHSRFRPADGAARWGPENPEVAGNQRTAPLCTTYQLVILANAGIQAIGESDDWDEDSRQALVSSECGAPFCWLLIFGEAKISKPSAGRNRRCKSNSRSEHQQNIQDNRR